MDNRPIGIFDSGLGGLTVLSEYVKTLPNEDYIYFGDNARVPYGSKSKETIIEYSRQIVKFLISKDVKLIVIACGTASANAFDTLKNEFNVPIRTIITPTAKQVKEKNVGIIATKATITSKAWENAIKEFNPDCNIYSKACPLFVPIVEEGLVKTELSKLAIKMYLNEFLNKNIDNLILGCTHYPILYDEIKAFFPEQTKITNVNVYSALDTKEFLEANDMLNLNRKVPEIFAYTTDDAKVFLESANNYCHLNITNVQKVSL